LARCCSANAPSTPIASAHRGEVASVAVCVGVCVKTAARCGAAGGLLIGVAAAVAARSTRRDRGQGRIGQGRIDDAGGTGGIRGRNGPLVACRVVGVKLGSRVADNTDIESVAGLTTGRRQGDCACQGQYGSGYAQSSWVLWSVFGSAACQVR